MKVLGSPAAGDNQEGAIKPVPAGVRPLAHRCFVCGFRSRASICPRCNTILREDRVACPRCGRILDGMFGSCESCGTETRSEHTEGEDREARRTLASVPGITEEHAKALVAKGFRNFADVVRLALPDRAVRLGLHHAIARKVMLADLVARPERQVSGARCPMCGAAWVVHATRCAACGSTANLELDPFVVEQKLQEITGEIVDLATDDDFRQMPSEIRSDLLEAFGGVSSDDLLREECQHQVEAWRSKGFDVAPIERILEEDLTRFREQSARLIRAQLMKKTDSGKYRCPLCEVLLESTADECGNCGARFS